MGCREGEEVVVEDMVVFVFWQVDQALRQGFFLFFFFCALPRHAWECQRWQKEENIKYI